MKKSVLKTLRLFFTACFAFFLLGAGVVFAVPSLLQASAEETEENKTLLSTQYQTDGSSVRVFASQKKKDNPEERELVETAKKGIRFHVETGEGYEVASGTPLVDVNAKNEKNGSYVLASGYKTYTLVIPTRLLDGDLLPSTSKVLAIETTENWFTDKDGNWESVAYIYNVPENMYTDNFSFRGIICRVDGDTETVIASTDIQERSLTQVAKLAYKDTIKTDSDYWGTAELDDQAADLIKAFVPTYTITYTDVDGNQLGDPEEVLWGDAPVGVPNVSTNTWYDTTGSEEIDVTQELSFTENRTLTLIATTSNEFVLTGVAAYAQDNGYTGVKAYATLPTNKFENNTELDIHAVNVTHSGSGTFTGLAGVWTMQESGQMRLFFGFKDDTELANGDTLTISADSVFYADGVMYKLTEEYVIDYNGIDYGMFLGYLNNAHVKAIYNAAEDASGQGGTPNDFTIRVEFYEDIMITDSFVFQHPESIAPVYIQCGEDKTTTHTVTGGQYYWVEDKNQPDGYTKILELIATDAEGNNLNTAYGKHNGDTLYGLAGTKLIQNGGYYVFEDEMYAYFLPTAEEDANGVVEGYWTVGTQSGAYGAEEFDKFGSLETNADEVRFSTSNLWFDTENSIGTLTVENMSSAENAVYYTSADGTVTPLDEFVYHGYSGNQIFGIRGVSSMQVGDTITIVGGTRFWYKQNYCTIGDLVGEERTKNVVFCYNGREWFSRYDESNNVTVASADVSWISRGDADSGAEVRIWLSGQTNSLLSTTRHGSANITGSVLYNGVQRTSGLHYGSGANLVSFDTGVTTAKAGDYFIIPAGSTWWTLFYANQEVNRAVIFKDTIEATFNGTDWVSGNHQATFDYVGGNFTVNGIEKGYLYQGNSYTFNVEPTDGYVLSKVSINGVEQTLNENHQFTFTAQANNTLEVETVVGYNVTFSVAEGATVDSGAIVNGTVKAVAQGSSLSFSVAASEGYKLTGVSGATNNNNGTYTISPTADTTVTITTEKLYWVAFSGTNASATVNSAAFSGAWVENGGSITFTVTADSGYTLMSVSGATNNGDGTYTITANGANATATAIAVETSSLTIANYSLAFEYRTAWDPDATPDNHYFGITYINGTKKWLNTKDGYTGYWNDNGATLAKNNYGVDIMEYILIDGVSTRELVTANDKGDTSYVGTATFPLTNGGIFAPVTLETTTDSGLMIRVLKTFKNSFTLTIKAGFTLPDEHGNTLYVSEDISYQFENGTFTKVLTKSQIDATNLIGIENRTGWDASANPDHLYFALTCTGETNDWLNVPDGYLAGFWNDHPENAVYNYGVDIMEYIYINNTSVRSLITTNANNKTYSGTTFPFSNGGVFAPVVVQATTGSGLFFRVLNSYVNDLNNSFNITIKAGFTLTDEYGQVLVVNSDINYAYNNGTLTRS